MILIDGYNIIGRGRALGLGLEERDKERRLLDILSRWKARKGVGEAVLVVFDGRGAPPVGGREDRGRAGIRVTYTSGCSADDFIAERVAKAARPREITVVSSDRAVRREVLVHGGRIVTSEEFLSRIASRLAPAESEKPERSDGPDLEEWLSIFSGEGEEGK